MFVVVFVLVLLLGLVVAIAVIVPVGSLSDSSCWFQGSVERVGGLLNWGRRSKLGPTHDDVAVHIKSG